MIVSSRQGVAYHSLAFSEISMLGEAIQTYEVPNLMHYEVEELSNGNILLYDNGNYRNAYENPMRRKNSTAAP